MKKAPNLLLIFSDQHRSCDLGCYGNKQVMSPNFDVFAEKAAVFTTCISNTPVCVPARGSLLTGLFSIKHRAVSNDLPINPDLESIADVMNDNGYHTGYIGKWHLAGIPREQAIHKQNRLGFSEWKVNNCNHDYMNAHYYDEDNIKHDIEGYERLICGTFEFNNMVRINFFGGFLNGKDKSCYHRLWNNR